MSDLIDKESLDPRGQRMLKAIKEMAFDPLEKRLTKNLKSIDDKLDNHITDTNQKIDKLDAKIENKTAKLEAGQVKIEKRMDGLETGQAEIKQLLKKS